MTARRGPRRCYQALTRLELIKVCERVDDVAMAIEAMAVSHGVDAGEKARAAEALQHPALGEFRAYQAEAATTASEQAARDARMLRRALGYTDPTTPEKTP